VVPREGVPPEVIRAAARRFSKLALASVLVLAATGAGRALAELSAVSQLWTTGYGRSILVKTGLFAVLIGLGSMSRSRVLGGVDRLRRLVFVELVLVLGVVVAVAVLTSLRPGRS
jgi:putative copper export protein